MGSIPLRLGIPHNPRRYAPPAPPMHITAPPDTRCSPLPARPPRLPRRSPPRPPADARRSLPDPHATVGPHQPGTRPRSSRASLCGPFLFELRHGLRVDQPTEHRFLRFDLPLLDEPTQPTDADTQLARGGTGGHPLILGGLLNRLHRPRRTVPAFPSRPR